VPRTCKNACKYHIFITFHIQSLYVSHFRNWKLEKLLTHLDEQVHAFAINIPILSTKCFGKKKFHDKREAGIVEQKKNPRFIYLHI